MKQEKYNSWAICISFLALVLSIGFPYFKQSFLDCPEISNTSSKYITLTHYFGNPSIGLDVNLINIGEKIALIDKIQISLFNGNNELLIKRKEANIIDFVNRESQNLIVLQPNLGDSYTLILNLNDMEDEEKIEEINNVNNAVVKYFNEKRYYMFSYPDGQDIKLNDSMYNKIQSICIRNMESLKTGDYKVMYYIYQVGKKKPAIIIGKRFKIANTNKTAISLSFENYRWGANIFNPNKFLYRPGSDIRVYEILQEDENILKENDK